MSDVARISNDNAIKKFIGKPVSETQITRILEKLRPSQIQALHELTLSLGLLDIAESSFKGLRQYVDIDATAVEIYGQQEGVEVGYIEKEKLAPCYQYLLFRSDRLNSILWGTIRGGAAHSQNGFTEHLKMILPSFSGLWDLAIRADAGYYNEDAFDVCQENKVYFFIRAPMIEGIQCIADSSPLKWIKQNPDNDVEWAVYETNTKARSPFNLVFRRERIQSDQPELLPSYKTLAVATNDMNKVPWEVFEIYNKRARIEKTNEELKNDYFLGDIITQQFAVNDIITQITIIAYQIMSKFRRCCLDKRFANTTLATLRTIFFNVPARILSTGHRTWTRVYNRLVDINVYLRTCARLMALQTVWAVTPEAKTG